jgi:hypothetical protein
VPIQFGDQKFLSVLDTGSSDTWTVRNNFQCVDILDRTKDQDASVCRFGPLYNVSSNFKQIPDQVFDIEYADGEKLSGIMGRETVTFAGIKVPSQIVGIVDYAAWMGDRQSSGLVGLAYPNITRAYISGTKAEKKGASISYSPIFTSMIKQNLTTPVFSLALGSPGVLAFGGLPGAPTRYNPKFAKAAIEFLSLTSATNYQFYTISADGFSFSAAATGKTQVGSKPPKGKSPSNQNIMTVKSRTQVIIDSGTTLLFLPANITRSINSLWSPPAEYNDSSQTYFVQCNALAPRVGVQIDSQTFWVSPKDLVQDAGIGTRTCMSGVQPGNDGISVLGDVFLKSVVAVFDVGAGEMRFAARR